MLSEDVREASMTRSLDAAYPPATVHRYGFATSGAEEERPVERPVERPSGAEGGTPEELK